MSIQIKLFLAGFVFVVGVVILATFSWNAKARVENAVNNLIDDALPAMARRSEATFHFETTQEAVMQASLWGMMNRSADEQQQFVDSFEQSLSELDQLALQGVIPDGPYEQYRSQISNAMTLVQRNPRIGYAALRGASASSDELAAELLVAQQAQRELVQKAAESASIISSRNSALNIALGAALVVLAGLTNYLIGRSIGGPIVRVTKTLQKLSEGHLDIDVEPTKRRDEIGVLINVVGAFRSVTLKMYEQEKRASELAKVERSRRIELEIANHATETANKALQSVQQEIERIARTDRLTGLGNRLGLEERLNLIQKTKIAQAVVAIDLDRFKEINDTYGHAAGDEVLRVTGTRLAQSFRSDEDCAFRIGGDEFVILLTLPDDQGVVDELCSDLLFEVKRPVKFRDIDLKIGCSIGFSIRHPDDDLGKTLHNADLALYRSKDSGRDLVTPYVPQIGREQVKKISLIRDFKAAIEQEDISIELQPQVAAVDHKLTGCEVLARWEHPEFGRISPEVFIPLALENGLISVLDRHVLDLALDAFDTLTAQGIDLPGISVNVSSSRLNDPLLLQELRARKNIPAGRLNFEIVETAFYDSIPPELKETLAGLTELGVGLEIDDFGTGHASLAGVLSIKPGCLKIDRMFVKGIEQTGDRRNLMQSLLEIAKSVGANAIVEGVETGEQADTLCSLGANSLQGYFFSQPKTLPAFADWVRQASFGSISQEAS